MTFQKKRPAKNTEKQLKTLKNLEKRKNHQQAVKNNKKALKILKKRLKSEKTTTNH